MAESVISGNVIATAKRHGIQAVELVPAVGPCNRSLRMHINKVHVVRTLALVASELGEDAD